MTDQAGQAMDVPARQGRLTRLRFAFVSRDWVGIAIEVGIVTLGILLAFEIEQWGQRRSQEAQQRQFLERLYLDNVRNITDLQTVIASHRKAVDDIGSVLRHRDEPAVLQGYAQRLSFGCAIATLPSAPFNDTSWQELIASGRLNLIEDPTLRRQVRDVAAVQQQGSEQLAYSRDLALIIIPAVNRYYRFRLRDGPDQECRIRWPELVKDQEALNSLSRGYRMQRLMLQIREGTLAASLKLRTSLGCKLGKLKCGATSPPS